MVCTGRGGLNPSSIVSWQKGPDTVTEMQVANRWPNRLIDDPAAAALFGGWSREQIGKALVPGTVSPVGRAELVLMDWAATNFPGGLADVGEQLMSERIQKITPGGVLGDLRSATRLPDGSGVHPPLRS
jgi:hypothetical protein